MANKYNHSNFALGTVSGSFTAAQTSLDLTAGHGNRFPTAPFRVTLWNATDYTNPSDAFWAGAAEIIEVGGKTASSFTSLTRGCEGTSGIASVALKTYRVICSVSNHDIENYKYFANVKDFGAVGDGVADDSDAVQAALDGAAVAGGEIFLPAGNYYILGGRLFYKSIYPLKITGSGTASILTWNPPAPVHKTITAATNATPIRITATGHGFSSGDWVWISGVTGNTAANGNWVITWVDADSFTLNGSVGNGDWISGGTATKHKDWAFLGITGTEKANAYHCTGVSISDLKINFGSSRAIAYDSYHRGINIFNTDNIIIERCYLKGCRAECIGLGNFGALATVGSHAIIRDNYIYDCAQDAINPNVFDAIITGNQIVKCAQGIEAGRSRLTINDNYFEDILSYAIGISSVDGFTVTGNRLYDCINDVDSLTGVVGAIQIAGGGATDPSTNGIISCNSIINPTNHAWQAGINATRGTSTITSSKIIISENVIDGAMRGIYINGLDSSLIQGNHIIPRTGSVSGIEVANVAYNNNNLISKNYLPGSWVTAAYIDATSGQGNIWKDNIPELGIGKQGNLIVEGFYRENVAANLTADQLVRYNRYEAAFRPMRACYITGIGAMINLSVGTGSCTVLAYVAGSPIGISTVLNSSNPTVNYTLADSHGYACPAGGTITVHITTTADWAHTTGDLDAWVELDYQ